jgi:hypothetical protein
MQSGSVSLDQRREFMARYAQQQGWTEGHWQYDPSSSLLYTLCPVDTFEGTVATSGSNSKQNATWTVTLTPDSSMGAAAGGVQSASAVQLLGMLSKASLLAAAQQVQGVAGAHAALLPPGVLGISNNSSHGPAMSEGRGGGRGGGRGVQGAGRAGAGRGGAQRARGSNFPNVLQVRWLWPCLGPAQLALANLHPTPSAGEQQRPCLTAQLATCWHQVVVSCALHGMSSQQLQCMPAPAAPAWGMN